MKQGLEFLLTALLTIGQEQPTVTNPNALEYVAGQFETSNLVLLGDSNHSSQRHRRFVIDLIPYLKKAGVTHFAVELPSEFKESIEKYFQSDKSYKDENIDTIKDAIGSWPFYLDIAYEFYKAGIKVVPIDKNIEAWAKRQKIDDRTILITEERNPHMAAELEKIFEENPDAKILCFTGAAHTRERNVEYHGKLTIIFYYPPFAAILKGDYGIDPTTILLIETNASGFRSPFGKGNARYPHEELAHHRFRGIHDGYVNLNPTKNLGRPYKPQKTMPRK